MSSPTFDLDAKITGLEHEWRQAFDASIAARAEYQALAANSKECIDVVDMARERLERAESRKSRVLAKIERLDHSLLGQR